MNVEVIGNLFMMAFGVWMTLIAWNHIAPKGFEHGQNSSAKKIFKFCGPPLILLSALLVFVNYGKAKSVNLQQVAVDIKTRLKPPAMVDSETRLDDVRPISQTELGYYLTIVNMRKDDPNLSPTMDQLKKMVQSSACTNPNYKMFFDQNIGISIFYSSNDGVEVARVSVSANDCIGKGS